MKTITLRTLVREPLKVKRWVRAESSLQVTDKGKPLWVIRDASVRGDDKERNRGIDEVLEETLLESPTTPSAVDLLEESRR